VSRATEQEAVRLFREEFGQDPAWVAWAPGRVNLIGEHTDYQAGFVLPAAIAQGTAVAAGPTDGPTRLASTALGLGEAFDSRSVEPGSVDGWARYAAGMAWRLRPTGNVLAAVASDLPVGAGLSSSAAIETAFGLVWQSAGGRATDAKGLALEAQAAENRFVGVACGVMDMLASGLGQAGAALLIDTRSLEVRPVPLPAGLAIVVCDTQVPRSLAASAYNERVAETAKACGILAVESLRDATEQQVFAGSAALGETLTKRALHIVTENSRCLAFVDSLVAEDRATLALLAQASHDSLRNNYQVSSVELDVMQEATRNAPGCWASRMTGAGFGGACVALVESDQTGAFVRSAQQAYVERIATPEPSFLVTAASDGARLSSFIGPADKDFSGPSQIRPPTVEEA
jgi:galactokinase